METRCDERAFGSGLARSLKLLMVCTVGSLAVLWLLREQLAQLGWAVEQLALLGMFTPGALLLALAARSLPRWVRWPALAVCGLGTVGALAVVIAQLVPPEMDAERPRAIGMVAVVLAGAGLWFLATVAGGETQEGRVEER